MFIKFLRKKFFLLSLFVLIVTLTSCENNQENKSSNETFGIYPTPKDYLEDNNADIFVFHGTVYSNAENLEWVEELEFTLGERVGTITRKTDKAEKFNHETANILPVGTKIYNTDKQILIAIVNGKKIPYLKMTEG